MCQYEAEDNLHVLRECPVAKDMWKLIVSEASWSQFFSNNLLEWVKTNLGNHGRLPRHGVPWSTLFGILAWRIWKNKNLFVFQELTWSSVEAIKVSISWAKRYNAINSWDSSRNSNSEYLLGN
ncbi:hypothetical protein J1N35_002610 [Gossypium stocksii]|uniref:Reverse transcriptase zinc-binding domain-containing protein n=1 Tax=Gossypium stocksii TaxID=47602 RepID=A0A9D3WJT4_9ROSI|nr:hypothetical protein J1N35_002610 [Gossypium stocksii]